MNKTAKRGWILSGIYLAGLVALSAATKGVDFAPLAFGIPLILDAHGVL